MRIPTLLLALVAFPVAGATQAIVCALGPGGNSYHPGYDRPPSEYASRELSHVYSLLCPGGCGPVTLVMNETTPNALSMSIRPGVSKIAYSSQFMNHMFYNLGANASFGVMAHELGHHIDFINPAAWMDQSWGRELRADAWAGCALARSGRSPAQTQMAVRALAAYPSPSHPGWPQRSAAIQAGFAHCSRR